MFNIGFQELLIILLVALLLFGGRRLPELAKSLGAGLREFRSAVSDVKKDVQDATAPSPPGPADARAPVPELREPSPPAEPQSVPQATEDATASPGDEKPKA